MSRLKEYLEGSIAFKVCSNCEHWRKQNKNLGTCYGITDSSEGAFIETSEGEGASLLTSADFSCANFKNKGRK
jgi:hypothetical protein